MGVKGWGFGGELLGINFGADSDEGAERVGWLAFPSGDTGVLLRIYPCVS